MNTFNELNEYLQAGRNPSKGRPLERNTRIELVRPGVIGVRFWNTIILTVDKKNTYTLFNGGYFTKTTKDRLNSYSPLRVTQEKGVWYVGESVFFDGLKIRGKKILNPKKHDKKKQKNKNALDRKIKNYAKAFRESIEKNGLSMPSGGDCWGCCMKDQHGKTAFGTDHLIQHLEENYFVPSLVANAIQSAGYNPGFWFLDFAEKRNLDRFEDFVKKYLRKNLITNGGQ